MRKKEFYKILYENYYITIEILQDTPIGNLVNIYIADNAYIIKKYTNVFIKLDYNYIKFYGKDYEDYMKLVAQMLLKSERTNMIIEDRSGNFGELRYNKEENKIDKYSYDKDGVITEDYRKNNDCILNVETIDLKKIKNRYIINDKSYYSSINIVDSSLGSYLIEYLSLESIELQNTLDSYGDLVNITLIYPDHHIVRYNNVFITLEKELLLSETNDAKIYKEALSKILFDEERNYKVLNQRAGNFGIILFDSSVKKTTKYLNNRQIDNINYIRDVYNCELSIDRD